MASKGVSPLVAVAVLIGLTMAAAVIVILFTQTQIKDTLRTAEQTQSRVQSCINVRLVTENAVYDDVNKSITAVMRNVGTSAITNFRMVVYYQSDPVLPNIFIPSNYNAKMDSGSLLVIKANGVSEKPDRLFIDGLWARGECPDIQPLYECRYQGVEFIC